jgi:CheY-like chemotaxis protein
MDSKRDGVILVVDDEELIRMNAAELLEDAGYAVVQARDAAEALAILEGAARRPAPVYRCPNAAGV